MSDDEANRVFPDLGQIRRAVIDLCGAVASEQEQPLGPITLHIADQAAFMAALSRLSAQVEMMERPVYVRR